jgi:hypothetical protein
MFNYVPIKHNQMPFVPNGGKLKHYTVLNGLIFPTPTQPRISFERANNKDRSVDLYEQLIALKTCLIVHYIIKSTSVSFCVKPRN